MGRSDARLVASSRPTYGIQRLPPGRRLLRYNRWPTTTVIAAPLPKGSTWKSPAGERRNSSNLYRRNCENSFVEDGKNQYAVRIFGEESLHYAKNSKIGAGKTLFCLTNEGKKVTLLVCNYMETFQKLVIFGKVTVISLKTQFPNIFITQKGDNSLCEAAVF